MAFNVEDILSASMYKEPWEHKIVDDSIDPDIFKKLALIPKMLLNKNRREYPDMFEILRDSSINNGGAIVDIQQFLKLDMPENIIELLYDCAQSLLDSREKLLEQFSYHRESSSGEYYADVTLGFICPGVNFDIHQGPSNRALTCHTYLAPRISSGHRLHKDDTLECISDIDWKPNRSLIFAPQENVTFTSYFNPNHTMSMRFVLTTTIEFVEYKDIEFSTGKKFRYLAKNK